MATKFVKVRHEDGREADITTGEVAFYKTLGFKPVDDAPDVSQAAAGQAEAPATPLAAANGTDQRLELVLDELRGLRADLKAIWAPAEQVGEPIDGQTVELKEPAKESGPAKAPAKESTKESGTAKATGATAP
jgi:hypothetical protein